MMAMLRLWKSEVLKRLGWQLLLQIHDEVILEGPKESVDEVSTMKIITGQEYCINLNELN